MRRKQSKRKNMFPLVKPKSLRFSTVLTMTKMIWKMAQVLYLPQYESLRKAPTREKMYTVPVHLLTLLAASALFCCKTLVRNSTKFTPTPKNARVARP